MLMIPQERPKKLRVSNLIAIVLMMGLVWAAGHYVYGLW